MVKKWLLFLSLTMFLLPGITACASPATPLKTPADFTGFITEIQPDGEKSMRGLIHVESHADKLVNKYIITIKDETMLFRQNGDNYSEVSFKSFENKQWVRIWFTGPILESFPMQATASQVVITTSP